MKREEANYNKKLTSGKEADRNQGAMRDSDESDCKLLNGESIRR